MNSLLAELNLGTWGTVGAAWLAHILVFIGVWTGELFYVQAITLRSSQEVGPKLIRWAPRIRLALDLCFVGAISLLVPRIGLAVISAVVFLAHLGLLSHYDYFLRPLSALSLIHNWREGTRLGGNTLPHRPRRATWVLGSLLLFKLTLLFSTPDPHVAWEARGVVGLTAIACYFGLAAAASFLDPLSAIRTTRGIGRLGMIRGYLITWLAEFHYLGRREVLAEAMRRRQLTSDRLTPLETAIPIRDRLVIIQAESLDYNVLGLEVHGEEVTPLLNSLRKRSLFYRIAAARYVGSADADCVMLTGVPPSLHMVTYNLPGYPYDDSLPHCLARFGYRTTAFHGNTGNFYNRRNAFEKMGFAEINFSEELTGLYRLPMSKLGVADHEVLSFSARQLSKSSGRECHFVITLTTHTPYNSLTPEQRELFPRPRSMAENYLNNMRYLDNQLRAYLTSGAPATVVIYSDHPASPGTTPDFKPDRDGSLEFVPCFIHDTELDLGGLQQTQQRIARDGTLTLVDISNFLRGQVSRAGDSATSTAASAAGSNGATGPTPDVAHVDSVRGNHAAGGTTASDRE